MNLLKPLIFAATGLMIIPACTTGDSSETTRRAVFSPENMDTTVAPGENFYLYANGGWIKNHPLPDDKSRFGAFDMLAEENREKVKTIIEEAAQTEAEEGTVAQQIGDFFASGMDTVAIDKAGLKPLSEIFALIETIENPESLVKTTAALHQQQIYPFFYLYSSPDRKNSDMVIANFYQGGLGLPDRDYYFDESERGKKLRDAYIKYLTTLFVLKGETEEAASQKTANIMELETRMAKASNTRLENRDPQTTYNPTTLEELPQMAAGFDWSLYFSEAGLPEPGKINVGQPKFMAEIAQMANEVSPEMWRDYFSAVAMRSMAPYLTQDFVEASFEMYGRTLSGQPSMEPRWKRVLNTTSGALGEAVGQLYVEKFFPPEAKERMLELTGNLRKSFARRIDQLEWMSDDTKKEAHKKLEAIKVKIGYPDKWRDYSGLEVSEESYAENVLRSNRFDFIYDINKIGKPVDEDEWHMTPQTVNAYYSPLANEIVFPAAILQPPFFYPYGDDAVNYGAIGMVIGHEMTHGFDDKGRQYDMDGNMNDWWQPADAENFENRAQVLIDRYDNFTVLDTVKADGELTLGENIADLGGLNIAYQAYKMSLEGKDEPANLDGFTDDQRFFLAYARVWAQNIRNEEILRRTKEDVHSLGKWRVNGPLPNMQAFVEAFDIDAQEAMYLAPEKRASIW
ncbi:M13 family metallopeptidase [Marinilabilia salmonicolor]|uniref:Putative endopeptidase n=1 Tax=Marinilabilia salmonicolor TaxID=989 RepID=A0A368VHW5_9BACT|nr:M13 family metallopeptidase [Marinilabilia salmonicolor]RCW38591.1 putative endopeptidase [Marinilabilia salmonicolor]